MGRQGGQGALTLVLCGLVAMAGCQNGTGSVWRGDGGRQKNAADSPSPSAGALARPPGETGGSARTATDTWDTPGPVAGTQTPATLADRPVVIQSIRFQILRVRAAEGVFSRSGKIWNPLDPRPIKASSEAALQRNGLRAGVGRHAAWPQIKALLDVEDVEVSTDHRTVFNGLPLTVETARGYADYTLFLLRPDGSMAGRTFRQSAMVLRFEYAIPITNRQAVQLAVMPEIRQQRVQERGQWTAQGWQQPLPYEPSRPLRELTAQVTLEPGTFLAIGPAPNVYRGHLAGSLLLCEEIDGRRFESMYFVTPEVINTSREPSP